MTKLSQRRAVYGSLLGVILLATCAVCFVDCASGEHANDPSGSCKPPPRGHHKHHPHPPRDTSDGGPPDYISCRGTDDCDNSEWYPECADPNYITCVAPASAPTQRECIFRVTDQDTGCFCLERDIRSCGLGGGQGIQHCLKTGTDETAWGGCGGL